uniref:TSA: Wollemia nobilis Ref_Wollemi_Transcript_12405_1408 transcribed RNA sequence n=1 Tax=Wollemia nobilis TaxID=56998 RepID=A0A0C9S845_9CONI
MADRSARETSAMYEMSNSNSAMHEASALSSPCPSNLECFLDCTTPRLPAHYIPKTSLGGFPSNKWWEPSEEEGADYFSLGDLWDRYDEWSAYGAGVPILLNGGETVVQYYVPYLSAIQIYTATDLRSSSSFRNVRDESDGDFELRDSSSDSCSDSESGNFSERSLSFRSESCNSSERLGAWDAASEDFGVDHLNGWHLRDRLGYLCLDYFERAVPSARVPLMEKRMRLEKTIPSLVKLRLPSAFLFHRLVFPPTNCKEVFGRLPGALISSELSLC